MKEPFGTFLANLADEGGPIGDLAQDFLLDLRHYAKNGPGDYKTASAVRTRMLSKRACPEALRTLTLVTRQYDEKYPEHLQDRAEGLSAEHRKRLAEEVAIVFEQGYSPDSFPWAREVFYMPWSKRKPTHFRKSSHRLVAYSVDSKGRVVRYWHHKPHDDGFTGSPMEAVCLKGVQVGVITSNRTMVCG